MKVNHYDDRWDHNNVHDALGLIELCAKFGDLAAVMRSFAVHTATHAGEVTPELKAYVKGLCACGGMNGTDVKLLIRLDKLFPKLGLECKMSVCTYLGCVKGTITNRWGNHSCYRCHGTGQESKWSVTDVG